MSDRLGFPSRFLITDKPPDEAFERLGSIPGLLARGFSLFGFRHSFVIRHWKFVILVQKNAGSGAGRLARDSMRVSG